ncbi:MAG: ABC transporter ATP-binding protein, partial [archaeon]
MRYKLRDVVKSYGETSALKGIDLDTGDEFLGIIGHSGVGKTTLLKILAGLEAPTGGVLYFDDEPVTQSNRVMLRKSVTMIFQTPVFLRGDVYTNIAYGLRLRGTGESEIEEKVESALGAVRLSGLSSRDTRELSGGEQQRVALARALVLDPEVMLLDEPTSNLDPGNVSIINDILLEESLKRVLVIATHDLVQVSKITDRVVFMENGVITEDGSPEVLEALTRLTENIFTGVSKIVDGVSTVDLGGVEIKFTKPVEGRVSLHVRPQDIFLSNDWVETSARNQFRGSIVGVEEKNGVVLVSVHVGVVFRVQITRKSFDDMGLDTMFHHWDYAG